ncbi:TM2 domain-containing protein [Williamsia sp. MIQD14]|uniref:TM2 domain-containing protein n=1 Tax=Williamsia sp. MIQD14 TaxID=3425703 RepID=UPI003DA02E7F
MSDRDADRDEIDWDPWWDSPEFRPHPPKGSSGYSLPGMAGVDDPWAPWGRDPATGTPLSSRSKRTAGLLQLTLGGFGAGRFYLGHMVIGVAQLLTLILAWYLALTHPLGVYALLGLATWTLVDSITMLSGGTRDGRGLVLRP